MTLILDNSRDNIAIEQKKQQEIEYRFLATVKHHKGHKIWQFNTTTGKLSEAEFNDSSIIFNEDPTKRAKKHSLIMKKDCIYVSALNMKNAFRKFNKYI